MKNFSFYKGRRAFWYSLICGIILNHLSAYAVDKNPSTALRVTKAYETLKRVQGDVQSEQQTLTLKGKITDAQGPMPGVNITVKGTTQQTTSNYDGSYVLKVQAHDILIFSFLGYHTIEIALAGRRTLDITMREEATALQEVKVNAGYYAVKEKERTGSIAKISAKDIEKQPVANILATMQGRMAGVNVVQESGIAGGGFNITIRGLNSLREGGNAPLYVIDGVPYATDPISDPTTSTATPGNGNPLSSINPADIESLEILKDADATAIYGSRGANGVVLITTKKGKAGKAKFTLNAMHSAGTVTKMMDLMHTEQYLTMRRKAFANDGYTSYPANAYDVNGTWDPNRYTDWQEELIGGTSEVMGLQGSVSGGSEQTKYLLSGNYRTETSVFPGDFEYRKGGAHVSFDHASDNEKFRIHFTGSYTAQHNDLPWIDFVWLSRQLAPNAPALYDAQGNLNWENSTWVNPLSNLESKSIAKTTDLIANTLLSYQLGYNFEFKSSLGFTDLHNGESRTAPSTMFNPAYNIGSQYSSIFVHTLNRKSWIIEPQLNWHGTFGKSKITVLAGGTFQDQQSTKFGALASGFASNSLIYDLASASTVQVIGTEQPEYKYQAFFGRVNYTYDDRYIVNLAGRRDGSSRFGPGKQFATFGAVGAAWLFYKEGLISKNASWLSFGKLRSSYGITGNDQIGDYQFLNTYMQSGYPYDNSNGLQPARLYNPDFGWETNRKFEAALELGFLNDRVFLTAAWYRNRSSNQLVGLPLPGTTGFTTIQANLDATVENTGFEATLRTQNIKTNHFSWTTNFNITKASNKLLSFPGLEYSGYRGDYVIGQPTTIRKLFHFLGVNPQTGLYEFEDVNGDGIISHDKDRQTIKDINPEYYGGLQNQLTYNRLQLDFLLQFVKQENFNFASTQRYPGVFSNQPLAYADSWQQAGDTAPYQLYTTGVNGDAMQAGEYFSFSDAAVSDASYIRLKNISLSYDFPKIGTTDIGCRLSLQAQNLLTLTSYKGADPEFTQGKTLPPLRIVSAGIQVTF